MERTNGGICVETEHIFPIIKKWLYSEKDIFLREIVSNACDACTKLKRLYSLGEAKDVDIDSFKINVTLNEEEGYIRVEDNGIGMSEDEVSRYLNQIALSGALDFIEKYDEQNGAEGIIGHFGLGFYSSFMVSDKVVVETKSYTDAPAVSWECSGEGRFEMGEGERTERGTSVTMYVSSEEKEFLSSERLRGILSKYCTFLPIPIYFDDGKECDCHHEDGECNCHHEPAPINDTKPLWTKAPSECTKEQYDELYHKLTGDYREPLFYIHINADYPLNFKGILYFPKHDHEYENLESKIQLYYNQVFVADSIKEIVPDSLIMLKGVLDCPELPLNVSRSYLQNDAYTKKISQHIAKKVADKLNSLFNTEREALQNMWGDLKPFVIYASLRDEKFYEKVKGMTLFKTCSDKYLTLSEYTEQYKESCGGKMFYTTDRRSQAQYISLLSEQGVDAVQFDTVLETQYVAMLEQKQSDIKFLRVDSELPEQLKAEGGELSEEAKTKLCDTFKALLSEGDEVSVGNLKNESVPAVLTVSEESRRFNDMLRMYRGAGGDSPMADLPEKQQLVLNASSALIKALSKAEGETAAAIAKQVVALAKLARRPLDPEEAADFAKTACELYTKLI